MTAYPWLQSSLCHVKGHDPDGGRAVCLDREGRGAEAKAVKEEQPTPLVGKSREHLRARLWEKLPDRQQ